ncbi:hypothetical protein DIPPA_55797, partial [Diplonema papillatum]
MTRSVLLVVCAASCSWAKEPTRCPAGGPEAVEFMCGSTYRRTNGALLRDMPSFNATKPIGSSAFSHTLEVSMALRMVKHELGPWSMTLRTWCINEVCTYPTSSLRVYPGARLNVNLSNELGPDSSPFTASKMNHIHGGNDTNLHLHGLHIDPSSDNVLRNIPSRTWGLYPYIFPHDHMPGVFWFHDHRHGSTAFKLQSGLAGALIVAPDIEADPLYCQEAPFMCEATAKILVLTYMPANCTCAASTDLSGYGTNAFNPVEYQMMRNLVHDTTINDSTYDDSMLDPKPEVPLQTIMLVNGQYQPQMPMVKNVWYRFDIIMAAGDTVVELEVGSELDNATRQNATDYIESDPCEMWLVGLDSVLSENDPRRILSTGLAAGMRATVGIRCNQTGNYALMSNLRWRTLHKTRVAPEYKAMLQYLVHFVVEDAAVTAPSDDVNTDASGPFWNASARTVPYYGRSLLDTEPDSRWTMSVKVGDGGSIFEPLKAPADIGGDEDDFRRFFWLGVGANCSGSRGGHTESSECNFSPFGFTRAPFSNFTNQTFSFEGNVAQNRTLSNFPYRRVARMCDVDEFQIYGGGKEIAHPIHIHTNSFQLSSVEKPDDFSMWGKVGDWRDSMPSTVYTVKGRWRLDRFGGVIIMHCHFLQHEDAGMMDRWWVNPRNTSFSWNGSHVLNLANLTCASSSWNGDCNRYIPPELFDSAFSDYYTSVLDTCDSSERPLPSAGVTADGDTGLLDDDDTLSSGAIAGISVGSVAFVVCVIAVSV